MEVPPLPPKPDLEARPKGSLLWAAFVAFCVLGVVMLAAFFATPILLLAAGIFGIIGLQYLLWGWLFERIYRTPEALQRAKEEDAAVPAQLASPDNSDSRDQTWSR
jgi:hypothetical protein